MHVTETSLAGVLIIEPKKYFDARGFFVETYNKERYFASGFDIEFVQDNLSFSSKGVLRGLHYQNPYAQGKLVYVLQGEVWDIAVDVRRGSPQFGQWTAVSLSFDNQKQLYIPPGFAHGFCVLSETALFGYKCTEFYHQETEVGFRWDDPLINVHWPLDEPVLSERDLRLPFLKDIPKERLPQL